MPTIGEIKRGHEINQISRHNFIWHACIECGEERWVQLVKGKPVSNLCHPCADIRHGVAMRGKKSPWWKGGRVKESHGYILVKLYPDDFFYPMVNSSRYVFEHRLIVAKALGRCLQFWEIVHHKEGFAKDDNRYPETLQLVSDLGHKQLTLLETKIDKLIESQQELKQEMRLLRLENKNLREGIRSK